MHDQRIAARERALDALARADETLRQPRDPETIASAERWRREHNERAPSASRAAHKQPRDEITRKIEEVAAACGEEIGEVERSLLQRIEALEDEHRKGQSQILVRLMTVEQRLAGREVQNV